MKPTSFALIIRRQLTFGVDRGQKQVRTGHQIEKLGKVHFPVAVVI